MSKQYLESVRSILRRVDPIGLISGGAPDSEYDMEALSIANIHARDPDELATKIHEIFVKAFDERTAGPRGKYEAIAAEIVALGILDNFGK
ncbi:MAG: hypothetical protein QG626_253 [Patescibacteria group bacterium]|jgi:hypothetical protein|nr:hypothetical protein [Patescibacteria group bacterium]MDQ5952126.1 hypothetical protein [Patescibacteria group bacterium]